MKAKLALRAVIAFCFALAVGRFVLPTLHSQPQKAHPLAVAKPETVALQTAVAATPNFEIQKALAALELNSKRPMEQDFKLVDGGAENVNKRMSHFLSTQYLEGSLHRIANGFGESVRWMPSAEEIHANSQVAAVIGKASPIRGSVEKNGIHNRVVYRGTYPDTDEQMYVRPEGGIEHDILLKRLPSSVDSVRDLAYSGYLQLGQNLTLWDGEKQIITKYRTSHGVQIKNAFNNTVFYLRPPVAWDATAANADGSLNKSSNSGSGVVHCEYEFDFDLSGVKLAVVTPGKWLANANRAFPVVIDPNLGPFGLADGNPPTYVAAVGSDTLIPASAGGTKINYMGATNVGVQTVPLPFPFVFYGQTFNSINVHIDGYADFGTNVPDTANNVALPANGFDYSMFVYWTGLQFSNDPASGVYFFTDGTPSAVAGQQGNRRFVIEWHLMAFKPATQINNNNNNFNPFNPFLPVNNPNNNPTPNPNSPTPSSGGSTQSVISFNLVLFECESKFEFIIGDQGQTDQGLCTVGEQGPVNNAVVPPQARYIQYDFDSALGNGTVNPTTGQVTPLPPITPGTSLTFSLSSLSNLTVVPLNSTGCTPFKVCFTATVPPLPKSTCDQNPPPQVVGFQWDFGTSINGSEGNAFVSNPCHTYNTPGTYNVTLTVTDELGTVSNGPAITVTVCDTPQIVVDAEPQGGTAPLDVSLSVGVGTQGSQVTGSPTWYVDLLNTNGPLGQSTRVATIGGQTVSVRLDNPGVYKVTVIVNSTGTGGAGTNAGYTFLYVGAPNGVIADPLLITSSRFTIDWVGKQPRANGLPPFAPNNDTITMTGVIPLAGVSASQLLGKEITVILNGQQTIFDGILDANGHAIFGSPATPPGPAGEFQMDLPSGAFNLGVNGDFYVTLGLFDAVDKRLIATHYDIVIQDLFPAPGGNGAFITYDYHSNPFNAGPPPTGSAIGVYNFGFHTQDKVLAGYTGIKLAPSGLRRPGGRTLLISGAFNVSNAQFTLQGNTVFATLSGMLGRFGGDSLRPADDSDVVVGIGGWSETLNFSTTPKFKTTGKSPKQVFSFKRSKALGNTGVASLNWANQPGTFQVKTFAIPNDGPLGVGINPALGVQTLAFSLIVTPESGQVFDGIAHFVVTKTSDTTYAIVGSSK